MTHRHTARGPLRGFRILRLEDRITPAITTMWDPTYGALSVSSDGADSIMLGTNSDRRVTVNGTAVVDANLLTIEARLVHSMTISGGAFGNVIDLSQVEPLTFSGLSDNNGGGSASNTKGSGGGAGKVNVHDISLMINGGGGADTITGSQFADLIDSFLGADQIDGGYGDDLFYIRNEDISGITINGGGGENSLFVDYDPVVGAQMSTTYDVATGNSTILYGGSQCHTSMIRARQDAAVANEFVNVINSSPLPGGGGSVDLRKAGGEQVIFMVTDFSGLKKFDWSPKLEGGKEGLSISLANNLNGYEVRIDASSTPVSVDNSGTGNSLVVNTFNLGSSTTTSSVQVAGMAPITFSGMSAVSTEVRFYDAVALADLKALGVAISPSVTDNVDGTQTFSLTVNNNNATAGLKTEWITSIGLPKITPKISKESHGRVLPPGRIINVIPGAGVEVEFHDTAASLPAAHLAAGMDWSQEVGFTMTALPPGQSASNSIKAGHYSVSYLTSHVNIELAGRKYDVDLSSYFETGDVPTQSQFAAVLDSVTGNTPSSGPTTLIGADASGLIALVTSSVSGIDSRITTLTAGAHLYAGQQMVDVAFDGHSSGNAPATVAEMDLTGRYVVFESAATNLVAGLIDTNGATDIFLRDTILGKTYCLSQNGGITGNGASFDPHMTSDGGCVVFRSSATNLIIGVSDANNQPDLFEVQAVFGLKTEWITSISKCVSLVPNTNQTCNKGVGWSDVDGDTEGYTIAYLTDATNTGDPASGTGMRVRIERNNNATYKLLPSWTGTNTAGLTVSMDGSTVVLWTDANVSSLAGVPDTNGTRDILSINANTGVVTPVSINYLGTAMADGPSPAYASEVPAVSLDGRRIAFTSNSSTLIDGLLAPATDGVYLLELPGVGVATYDCYRIDTVGTSSWGSNNHDPSISADGVTIAWLSTSDYESGGPASGELLEWIKQCYDGKDNRKPSIKISVSDQGDNANGDSQRPMVAPAGGLVLFSSAATNIVSGDTNGKSDVFASALHETYRFQLSTTDPADVTLKYKPATDSYVVVNTITGIEWPELKASDGKKHFEVTSKWTSPTLRTITIDMASGLQRLGGNIVIHGDTGNEKVIVTGLTGMAEVDMSGGAGGLSSLTASRYRAQATFSDGSSRDITERVISVQCADVEELDNGMQADSVVIRSMNPVTSVTSSGGTLNVQSGSFTAKSPTTGLEVGDRAIYLVLNVGDDSCTINTDSLAAAAPGSLQVFANGGADTITYTGTTTPVHFGWIIWADPLAIVPTVVTGSPGDDTISIGPGSATLNGGAGNDVYLVRCFGAAQPQAQSCNDTTGTDRIDFSSNGYGVTFDMDSQSPQTYMSNSTFTVTGILEDAVGSPFDDTFKVKLLSVPRIIDGGSQVSSTGDTLIVDAEGKAATIFGGEVHVAGKAPISYTNFEHVSVINNAPTLQVAAIQINGGAVQRSRVTEIVVAFNQGATSFAGNGVPANNLVISNNNGGATVPFNLVSTEVEGFMVATITFPSGAPNYGSMPDGAFTLTVLANGLTTPLVDLDGNGDGVITPGGEDFATAPSLIHRLFGDVNGDRTVSQVDFNAFRLTFLGGPNIATDYDTDGQVSQADFNAFRLRFLLSV